MGETPIQEHKFDTLSLLAGLTESDAAEYSLEDILNEFGQGEYPAEQKQTHKEEEIVQQIQQAIDHEIEMLPAEPAPVISLENVEPEPPLSEAEALLRRHGVRLVRREQELPDEELPEEVEEKNTAPVDPQTAPTGILPDLINIKIKDVISKREKPHMEIPEEEEEDEENRTRLLPVQNLPSAEMLYHEAVKDSRRGRRLMFFSFLLAALSLYWTLSTLYGWNSKPVFMDVRRSSLILAAITAVSAVLSYETVTRGFRELFALQLRFSGAYALLLLLTVVSSFFCKENGRLPPCCAVCLLNFFALWGDTLHSTGIRRSTRPLMKEDARHSSATVMTQAIEGYQTVTRGVYYENEHVQGLLSENHMQQQMDGYAAAALIISVSGAVILKAKLNLPVLWSWNLLLAALIPLGGFVGYERPFAALARTLMKKDSALSGWKGAEVLKDADSVLMTDEDIFPNRQVKLSGVKLFDNCSIAQASSYMAAALEVAECELAGVFSDFRESSNGRRLSVTQFRRYEGGGIGAEITGDVVLVGSRRFMKLMGIAIPSETEIQNAVYMSVNGRLAALFVLHYKASAKVHRAMVRVIDQTGMKLVVGSRDFMITPKLLEDLFKIKAENLVFPSAAERDSLAALSGRMDGTQGAILPDDSFDSLSDITIFAKRLGVITRVSAVLCMLLSVIGSFILFMMLLRKAAVSAFTVFLLNLLVTLPVLLLTESTAVQSRRGEKGQEAPKQASQERSNRMEKPESSKDGKSGGPAAAASRKRKPAKNGGKAGSSKKTVKKK